MRKLWRAFKAIMGVIEIEPMLIWIFAICTYGMIWAHDASDTKHHAVESCACECGEE